MTLGFPVTVSTGFKFTHSQFPLSEAMHTFNKHI